MGSIFISYRRDDVGYGRTLYEFLCQWIEEADVFYDHESLDPGQKFRPELTKAIQNSKVFLVVIGPHWFSERNRQRLADPEDTTRKEIITALEQERAGLMTIIPVLCGGAGVPDNSLPLEIAPLFENNAHHLPESQFRPALQKLLDLLKFPPSRKGGEGGFCLTPRYRHRPGTTQTFHTIDHNLTDYFSDPVGHLSQLYSTLHKTGKAAVTASATTAALHGMGGVGKTQLALKYSHDYRDEYAGVWWFRAEDLGRLQQDCQQFCERCGVKVNTGEEHHQVVKRWLQEQPRWLLVYDNAEAQYGEQKETLHPFLPGGDHHVLITSRGNCWDGLAKPIELDVWDEEQALEFLRKRLEKATDEELRALCSALGGLPLALEQACAYIVKVGVSVDGYCKALEDWEKGEKLLDRKDSLATGYSHSVLATLSLAFGRLSEGARELLRLCAWCAPEPIPESLFRASAGLAILAEAVEVEAGLSAEERVGGNELLAEALLCAAKDDLLWGEAVSELTSFALIQRVKIDLTPPGLKKQYADHALLLHRLTQAVVIHRLSFHALDAPILTGLLNQAFPHDLASTDGWPLARVLGPHLLRLEEHFATGHIHIKQLTWLLAQFSTYLLDGLALYDQAITVCCRNLERSKQHVGSDHQDTMAIMISLAATLWHAGDYQGAKELQLHLMNRSKDLLGTHHPFTLTNMVNLASTLGKTGELQEAKAIAEQVLKHSRDVPDSDHIVLSGMHNLATIISDMGDLAGAKTLLEQVVERRKELLGQDHPETLTSMGSLATILYEIGNYDGAKILFEQIVERRKKLYGTDHPETLNSIGCLASVLWKTGDRSGARVLQEFVMKRREDLYGSDHPDTLTCMNNLASTLNAMGEYQGAKVLEENVLERSKKQFGIAHPNTTTTAWNHFMTLHQMKDRKAANAVIDEYLIWMLGDKVELHSAVQRSIRDKLRQIVAPR